MSRFRARSAIPRRSFRPQTDWAFTAVSGTVAAGESDVYDLSVPASEWLDHPVTIRRIRGLYDTALVAPDPQVAQSTTLALGIGVANEEAIAAPAVPIPFTDGQWDGWMWIDFVLFNLGPVPGTVTLNLAKTGVIDSRAMRKLEDNHLFFAIQCVSTAAVSAQYNACFRWLQSPSSRR